LLGIRPRDTGRYGLNRLSPTESTGVATADSRMADSNMGDWATETGRQKVAAPGRAATESCDSGKLSRPGR